MIFEELFRARLVLVCSVFGDFKSMLSRRSQEVVALLCKARALQTNPHPAPLFPASWPRAVVYPSVLQKVRAGEAIALSGNTGFTAGPHLHFDAVDILPQESECRIMERVHGNLPASSPTVRCRAVALRSQGLALRVCRASIDSRTTEWCLGLFWGGGGGGSTKPANHRFRRRACVRFRSDGLVLVRSLCSSGGGRLPVLRRPRPPTFVSLPSAMSIENISPSMAIGLETEASKVSGNHAG